MALKSCANVKEAAFLECHYRNVFELAAAANVAFLHLVAPPASFQLRVLMSLHLLLAGCQAAARTRWKLFLVVTVQTPEAASPFAFGTWGVYARVNVGISRLSLFVAIHVTFATKHDIRRWFGSHDQRTSNVSICGDDSLTACVSLYKH